MQTKIFALSLAAVIGLEGCATISAVTGLTTTQENQLISDAQVAVAVACGLEPTAASIGKIVAAGSPALATATEIASLVCSAEAQAAPAAIRRHARGAPLLPKIANPVPVTVTVNGKQIVITFVP